MRRQGAPVVGARGPEAPGAMRRASAQESVVRRGVKRAPPNEALQPTGAGRSGLVFPAEIPAGIIGVRRSGLQLSLGVRPLRPTMRRHRFPYLSLALVCMAFTITGYMFGHLPTALSEERRPLWTFCAQMAGLLLVCAWVVRSFRRELDAWARESR
jgi:hypothetical protein